MSREEIDKLRERVLESQQMIQLNVLESGFYRLPVVPKILIKGPRGKFYYVNGRGKKIYLKARQQYLRNSGNLKKCMGEHCVIEDDDDD